jgi:hypothetical protein
MLVTLIVYDIQQMRKSIRKGKDDEIEIVIFNNENKT